MKEGKLSPHEGREIELMLSGKKFVSMFSEGVPDGTFDHSVIHHINVNIPTYRNVDLIIDVLYLEGYKDWALELISILKESYKKSGFNRDAEKRIGELLCYSPEDIQFYLTHIGKHR